MQLSLTATQRTESEQLWKTVLVQNGYKFVLLLILIEKSLSIIFFSIKKIVYNLWLMFRSLIERLEEIMI